MLAILVTLIPIFVLSCVFVRRWKLKKLDVVYTYPTGPRGWPVLGNLPQIAKKPHHKLSQWSLKYGKMFQIHLVNRRAVVLSDSKLVKEVMSLPVATGKFKTDSMLLLTQGNNGLLNAEGKHWSEQKQFCMKTLIDFGFGSKRLQAAILDDITRFDERIQQQVSRSPNLIMDTVLKKAMNGALWRIIAGEGLEFEDQKVSKLLKASVESMNYTVQSGLAFFPWLKYIAPERSGYAGLDRASKDLHSFMGVQVQKHRQKLVSGSPRDLIDAYIEKMNNCTDPDSALYGSRGDSNTKGTLVELFMGGSHTASSTLTWLIFYLIWNPNIQNKILEEIHSVVGENRDPTVCKIRAKCHLRKLLFLIHLESRA